MQADLHRKFGILQSQRFSKKRYTVISAFNKNGKKIKRLYKQETSDVVEALVK